MAGFIIHPSEHLKDVLESQNVGLDEVLTIKLGEENEYLKAFLRGEKPVTEELAKGIAYQFGGSSRIWLALQEAYDNKVKKEPKETPETISYCECGERAASYIEGEHYCENCENEALARGDLNGKQGYNL
ncbi:MAG: helix-turn-helix transcriptional regulator [Flavobacterium sp.]